jgi:glutathione-independent formaldehyde dehydrogenase
MVRGRTTAEKGLVLGHEITGEVIELGRDVEFIKKGDIVSVPFNVACGRCQNCKNGLTGICLNVTIVPEELTDMWIWVVGSEVKQNT